MTRNPRVICPLVIAAGLLLGPQSWAFGKQGRQISVGDDPSVKNGSPAFVFVEVSDYWCLACRHGAFDLLPKVYDDFVLTGKLELVFLDLPLDMRSPSFKAAEAAGCADDQNAFWNMHGLLFDNAAPDLFPGYAELEYVEYVPAVC